MGQTEMQIMSAAANPHHQIPHARVPEAGRMFGRPTPLEAADDALNHRMAPR
jgi:hypothetical protein